MMNTVYVRGVDELDVSGYSRRARHCPEAQAWEIGQYVLSIERMESSIC